MSGARTEQPTPRRLREARRRGDVATSRELTGAAALLCGVAALAGCGPAIVSALAAAMRHDLVAAVGAGAEPWPAVVRAIALLGRAAAAPCAAATVGGLAAGALQTRGLFALRALQVRVEILHLAKGLARLWSGERLAAVALGTAKTCAAVIVAWTLVRAEAPGLANASRLDAGRLLGAAVASLQRVVVGVALALAALAVLDLLLARRRLLRRLRMTREEVVREHRDDEGDPRLEAERRRLHRALSSTGQVRRATCLVVNPTHVAVALEHRKDDDAAPHVLAKGVGSAAARLRAKARRAGVPIVRDIALARALYRLAEVGDAIPEELYDAVAAVLVHVHGLSREVSP